MALSPLAHVLLSYIFVMMTPPAYLGSVGCRNGLNATHSFVDKIKMFPFQVYSVFPPFTFF